MNEGQQIAQAFWFGLGTIGFIWAAFFSPIGPRVWIILQAIGRGIVAALPPPRAPHVDQRAVAPLAPAAPRTDGAGRAHAENDGAPSAGTPPAPLESGALTTDLVGMMRAIAGHKLLSPGDKKEATAKALGISKSGTSKRYAVYSAAWSMLYPEPAAPARPEFITEREERINREIAAESQAS